MATPLCFPHGIEIKEKIEAAVELTFSQIIEIDMHIKSPPWSRHVHSTSSELLVRKQVGNACYLGQVRKKRRRGQHLIQLRHGGGKKIGIGNLDLLPLIDSAEHLALCRRDLK